MTSTLEIIAIVIGVFFMFVASVGVLRLSDFYSRIHAPTKAATLGLIFLLLAVAVVLREGVVITKALLAVAFISATAPVGAHILARAAYRNNVPRAKDTELDEYAAAVRQREEAAPGGEEFPHARDLDQDQAKTR